MKSKEHLEKPLVLVGTGTCGISQGADKVANRFREELEKNSMTESFKIRVTGCLGFCAVEPIVIVRTDGYPGTYYCKVTEDDVPEIIEKTIKNGQIIDRLLYYDQIREEKHEKEDSIPFYKHQLRNVIGKNFEVDPFSIDDYIRNGGYQALKKVLTSMSSEQVIDEVKKSGLRGRGGAGFPTGLKWNFARTAPGDVKYVVMNGHEGDPGAFTDRTLMEGNPHNVLEGLMICAYAIGANEGFLYICNKFKLALDIFDNLINQAREYGILGKNILGSNFDFDVKITRGAGTFVCGEETAALNTIEGRIGEPRARPPYPAQEGLWGKPTNINNVKTLSNIPLIINEGGEWYSNIGTQKSKGTVLFSLAGTVNNTGVVEVPMGITLREIVYEIGNGIREGKKFKAVMIGGPSGGVVTTQHLDTPVDYDDMARIGTMMGSGEMVVMDENTCMVDTAKYFLDFTKDESCGRCSSCREGSFRMREILNDITNGEADLDRIDLLNELGGYIIDTSMCGLGQSLPFPVMSTIQYFNDEYYDHIAHHKCSASVCTHLFPAPCQNTCPAETNVPGYIQLIKEGKFIEAYDLNKEANPLPAVCGRVCPHPCEYNCKRGKSDDPIAIATLKRAAADYVFKNRDEYKQKSKLKKLDNTGKRVAIIGGGPGGLSAAYFLRRLGHLPTIYEAKDKLGGMMVQGIPPYRLPRQILDQEIQDILDLGVDVKLNTIVGRDIMLNGIKNDYDAIYITSGAPVDQKLGISGEDAEGVMSGLDLLKEIGMGNEIKIGKKVAVIGGGNAAIDAARSARRLGAEVTIVYRRMRRDMPAYQEEIEGALEEGIKLITLAGPTKIIVEDGKVHGLECVKMDLGPFDTSGRCRPVTKKGSEFTLEVDTIIKAIGQRPDLLYIKPTCDAELNRNGTAEADRWTMATTTDGIFIGGDAYRGPDTVIQAIADGKLAAGAIDKYLMGSNRIQELMGDYYYEMKVPIGYEEQRRRKVPEQEPNQRINDFQEIFGEPSLEDIQYEASRCLRCDVKEVTE